MSIAYLMLMLGGEASGADIRWVGYQNGCMLVTPETASWFHGDNWYNYSVPGSADIAVFDLESYSGRYGSSPHLIYFGDYCLDQPVCPNMPMYFQDGVGSIAGLKITFGDWSFDFGSGGWMCSPQPPTYSGALTIADGFSISRDAGSASLTLRGGTVTCGTTTANTSFVGETTGTGGRLCVEGPSSRLEFVGRLRVGYEGSGELDIRDGAQVVCEKTYFGNQPGGIANCGISGVGSLLSAPSVNGVISVGREGTATMTISNGASVYTWYLLDIGREVGGNGHLVVSGATSTAVALNIVLGFNGGNGIVTLENGVLTCAQVMVRNGELGGSGAVGDWLTGGGGKIVCFEHGLVNPGDPIGQFTARDFHQAPGGTLRMHIGGGGNSANCDKLDLSGTATLGGTLEIKTIAGYVPGPQDSFTIITADSIAGTFEGIVSDIQNAVVEYTDNSVRVNIGAPSAVGSGGMPERIRLSVMPNPFNPRTTIRFDLAVAGSARLSVFDLAGRLIRTMIDENLPQGSHEAVWDGRDSSGKEVGSGTYLARLESGGEIEVVRMELVR
jgi:T5SS/PEP-CTERM-associated repeat protein